MGQLEFSAAAPLMPGDLACVDCEHAAHVAGPCSCGCVSVKSPARVLPDGVVEAAMQAGERLRAGGVRHTCSRGAGFARYANSRECAACEWEADRLELEGMG